MLLQSSSLFLFLTLVLRITGHEAGHGGGLWCDHEEVNAYQTALDQVHSEKLLMVELKNLLDYTLRRFPCLPAKTELNNATNQKWMTADKVYEILKLSPDSELNESLFNDASLLVISYLFRVSSNGSDVNNDSWTSLDVGGHREYLLHMKDMEGHEADNGHEHEGLSSGQLENLLRTLSREYVPGTWKNQTWKCGDDGTDEKADRDLRCTFGETKSFSSRSLQNLMDPKHAGNQTNSNDTGIAAGDELLSKMLAILWMKLLSGECITEVDEDAAASSDDYLQSLFEKFGDHDSCKISATGLDRIFELLKIGNGSHDDPTDDHVEDHSGHDHSHKRKRRSTSDEHVYTKEVDVDTTCLSSDVLLKSFLLGGADNQTLTKTDLYRLCPAILQQAIIGCQKNDDKTTTTTIPPPTKQISRAEAYGYGTLAVGVVSLCVVFALVVVRWKGTKVYRYLITTMLGLAVGTLVGDALLHLIPEAIGAHNHDHEGGNHDDGVHVEPYVWKALGGCGSLWFYYNLQLFLFKAGSITGYLRKAFGRRKSISSSEVHDNEAYNSNATLSNFTRQSSDDDNISINSSSSTHKKNKDRERNGGHSHSHNDENNDALVHSHSSVAWMITIGDGIHNCADGLAIGAAFTIDWQTGLGTTIAIFTHELPHEFGDTAVLLNAGWSTKKVLLFQLLSQLTAFVGLYIGISVSESSEGSQQWIAAVASGMFLYIALADIVPELIQFFSLYSPTLIFLTSNLGIGIGFLAMILLAVYEEKIAQSPILGST